MCTLHITLRDEIKWIDNAFVEDLEVHQPIFNLTVGSRVLKPGESTTIESNVFMMHPGMDGEHDYAVHLKTIDSTNPATSSSVSTRL